MTWKIETECHNCYWLSIDLIGVGIYKICGHKSNVTGICQEEICPIKTGINRDKKEKLK